MDQYGEISTDKNHKNQLRLYLHGRTFACHAQAPMFDP
jgi:hypothetical protein